MRIPTLIAAALVAAPVSASAAGPAAKPTAHETRAIEGWTVRVDQRLLEGEGKATGDEALKLLAARLHEIAMLIPGDRLAKLREVTIQIDLGHGGLRSMQYHPSAAWLEGNGYDTGLAKVVHLPDAAGFAAPRHQHIQPWAVLHELAHAYHDQQLGFGEKRILEAWKRFKESGRYESVRHIDGRMVRHYALTDQKEFFAEMTEAYVGLNDFYPFHRADLRVAEPGVFELMETIWGELP